MLDIYDEDEYEGMKPISEAPPEIRETFRLCSELTKCRTQLKNVVAGKKMEESMHPYTAAIEIQKAKRRVDMHVRSVREKFRMVQKEESNEVQDCQGPAVLS